MEKSDWSKYVPSQPGLYLLASPSGDIELVRLTDHKCDRQGFVLFSPEHDSPELTPFEAIAGSNCGMLWLSVVSPF